MIYTHVLHLGARGVVSPLDDALTSLSLPRAAPAPLGAR